MNKKVLLTTTAMAMIAAMAVSADVVFSGSFEQGFDTTWVGSDNYTVSLDSANNNGTDGEAELDVTIADADGLWSLELGGYNRGDGDLFNDDMTMDGALTVDLAAGLATQGYNLPMGLSYTIGNASDNTGLSVFNDDDQDSDKIKAKGGDTFMVVDATYGDMVAAQVAFSPITDQEALDMSAEVMPMDGVSMAFGWAHAIGDGVAQVGTAAVTAVADNPTTVADETVVAAPASYDYVAGTRGASVEGEDFAGAAFGSDGDLFGGSFCVDADQLMDLGDYTVNTTGTLTYLPDTDTIADSVTNFAVNTTVGYGDYSAYVQYAGTYAKNGWYAISTENPTPKDYNSALNTWVEYDGFENTTVQINVDCLSLNDSPADYMEVGATVDYTMGAITYEMAPTYKTAAGDDTFQIFWNVQMDF